MSTIRSTIRASAVVSILFLLSGLAVLPAQAQPQEPPPPASDAPTDPERGKARLIIGPELGVFLPINGRTGDAFGEGWTNLGVGVGRVRQASPRGAFAFEFQVLRNTRSRSKALLLPLTATYRRGLLPPHRRGDVRPYVGLGTGLYLADLRSEKYGVTSGFRGAIGVTALAGMTAGDRARFEVRYLAVSQVKGFDLSGVNLAAGVRF